MNRADALCCTLLSRVLGIKCEAHGTAVLWAICFGVLCFVYTRMIFFPVLGIDTYTYALSDGCGDSYFEFFRGIWLHTLLTRLVQAPLVAPLTGLIFLAITFLACALVTAFWLGAGGGVLRASVLLILSLFPYFAAQSYFCYYHAGYALSTLFGVLSVLLVWQRATVVRMLVAIASVVAGAGFYQGSLTVATGLIGATLFLGLTIKCCPKIGLPPLFRAGIVQALGGLIYLLIDKGLRALSNLPELNRGYQVTFSWDWARPFEYIHKVLPGSSFLLPISCIALLALPFVFLLLRTVAHREQISLRHMVLSTTACALMVFSPLPLALVQPLGLAPRSLAGVAFVWGALALVPLVVLRGVWHKMALFCLIVLCCIFAFRNNYGYYVQALTTDSDIFHARRMIERLHSLPEFKHAAKPLDVAIAGCLSNDFRPWEQDIDSIFGISQFACIGDHGNSVIYQHPLAVLRFAGGHVKLLPTNTADLAQAKNRAPWPAAESVFWHEDHAVIWLGEKTRHASYMEPRLEQLKKALGIAAQRSAKPSDSPGLRVLPRIAQSKGPLNTDGLGFAGGHVDATTPYSEMYDSVTGWSFDWGGKHVPAFVALVNAEGRIVGAAATGVYRPDLVHHVAPDAAYAGFLGFVKKGEYVQRFAY